MKLTNAIAKAEKIAGQKIQTAGRLYWVEYKGYTLSFYPNGHVNADTEATNYYTTREGRTENDRNSDYWPGTFHENITKAFKHIDRMEASQIARSAHA